MSGAKSRDPTSPERQKNTPQSIEYLRIKGAGAQVILNKCEIASPPSGRERPSSTPAENDQYSARTFVVLRLLTRLFKLGNSLEKVTLNRHFCKSCLAHGLATTFEKSLFSLETIFVGLFRMLFGCVYLVFVF